MTRRLLVASALVVIGLGIVSIPSVQRAVADVLPAPADETCPGDHWVAAWTAATQGSSLGRPDDTAAGTADGPQRVFTDQTLRMVFASKAEGSALRIRLGNRFGIAPATLDAVTIGVQRIDAELEPGSVRALTFGGSRTVTIPAGGEVVSDPVFDAVHAFDSLAVSLHVAGAGVLDHHQWAQTTQFATPAGSGDHADDTSGAAFTDELSGWFGVTGMDVLAPRAVGAVVVLGDSISDGIGSSPNQNRRWPDDLARRLAGNDRPLTVVNAGISGNHVVTSGLTSTTAIGPSAVDRLDRDVLRVPGVTDVIVFEGINDIFMAQPGRDIAADLIDGYRVIIDRAHRAGLRVIGATITPAAMTGEKEAARLAVNEWIRTSGAYDAVVDFDAVARDPHDPSHVQPQWDAYLAHLNDGGYEALAQAVDPDLFQGTGC